MRIFVAICMCFSVLCSGQSKLDTAKKRLKNRTETTTTSNDSDDEYYGNSEENKQTFGQKVTQFLFIELIAKPIYHGTKYVLVGDAHNVSVYNHMPIILVGNIFLSMIVMKKKIMILGLVYSKRL